MITWILKKFNSIQTLVEGILEIKLSHLLSKIYRKSHPKTQTLIVLNKFVCYPNYRLIPVWILSYWESPVVAPIPSLIYNINKLRAWIEYTTNLMITKKTTKIKKNKIQWATHVSTDYDIYLDCWHFKLHLKTHFKIKANFKFSDFILSLCGTEDKVKRKERGMMKIIV